MNLITGGLGYIGSHLALALPPSIIVDDLSTAQPNLSPVLTAMGHHVVIADFTDEIVYDLMEAHGVKTVFHLAAKTSVMEGEHDPGLYYRENTLKTATFAAMAQRAGVQNFVYASSAAVYGQVADIVARTDSRCAPANWYGRTKWATEGLLQYLAQARVMNIGIARFFNVIGADPQLRTGRVAGDVLSLMIKAVRDDLPFTIYGKDCSTEDGTPGRDYIDVTEIAEKLVAMSRHLPRDQYMLRNFGTGRMTSVQELAVVLEQVSGKKLNYQLADLRPGEIENIISDNRADAEHVPLSRSVKNAWRYATQ